MLCVVEEAGRRWVAGCSEQERGWVPRRGLESWLGRMHDVEARRLPLAFGRAHAGVTLSENGAVATMNVYDSHSRAAASKVVMRSGRHYAQFTVVWGTNTMFGVIRPGWDVEGGADAFRVDGHCFYGTYIGRHYPEGIDWEGMQPAKEEGDRIGMLLDLDRTKKARQRRFLALSFKTLDDRKNSYVAIDKLRYLLATAYPTLQFEPVAKMLKRNVEEQSGLVDFFDYLSVMDFVLQYEPPDPALLYGTNTHMWHTLPMCVTITNVLILSLFGTVGDDKALDSANSFFTFLYAVEIAAKMFALRPGRFFRSASNRIDFGLVVAAIFAQVLTVIMIFEHKSF